MQTGIMLTTPGGNRFWHPCRDAAQGLAEMGAVAFTYGAAWDHPATVVEYGVSDGTTFTPQTRLKPKAD